MDENEKDVKIENVPATEPLVSVNDTDSIPFSTESVQNTQSQPMPSQSVKAPRPKWFMPALLAGFIMLGGGAAAYISVFQKSPENIWKSALSNTANGLEQYLQTSTNQEQSGFELDGDFKITSPIAADGSMKGAWNGSTGSMTANIGAGGARFEAELKTVPIDAETTPDIYMKVSGLEGLDGFLQSFGIAGETPVDVSSINDQWFFIDHTLIDQYTTNLETQNPIELTEDDLRRISEKMMVVLKERMFATEPDKAVFMIKEKVGKEDFEGTSSYKMRVAVNKENFKAFVTALKDAAKDTKLEELLLSGQEDIYTLEEALDFENIIKDLDDMDFSKAEADVWVGANGGFVRNVRLYPVEGKESSNYLDFGLDFKGGDVFPLQIKATIDDDGVKGTFSASYDINYKNADTVMSLVIDLESEGSPIKAVASLGIKGSNDQVDVEAPTDAKNIFEMFSALQSGFSSDDAPLYFDDSSEFDSFYDEFDIGTLPTDDVEL